jgi:hypothetical protein
MQPPADGSCTWFASNVLWQGGLAKTEEWTSEGYLSKKLPVYGYHNQELSGTHTAWNVIAFKDYLKRVYSESDWHELDFRANSVPSAQLGDLIFYDWGKGEGISHVSVVTSISPGQYPNVSEWSSGNDGSEPSDYQQRGWTYSEVSHKWLQQKYPHIKAYILHINTSEVHN